MPLSRWVFEQTKGKLDRDVVEVLVKMNDRIQQVHEQNKGLVDAYSKLVEMFENMVGVNMHLKEQLDGVNKKLGVQLEVEEHESSQGLRHPQLGGDET
jgi:hypothetical protein